MPKITPISQRKLIIKLKKFGFSGPYQEGKHPYMVKEEISITIPNPHKADISKNLLSEILRQAGISPNKWNKLS
jgi:predicted RNA binding protein YcfA (HicA-like mRNA interferase family)